jgi:hypothetical protein
MKRIWTMMGTVYQMRKTTMMMMTRENCDLSNSFEITHISIYIHPVLHFHFTDITCFEDVTTMYISKSNFTCGNVLTPQQNHRQ